MKNNKIKALKTKPILRGLSLAKTGFKLAGMAASHAMKKVVTKAGEQDGIWSQYLTQQAQLLAQDFGQLKGSVMKVGQMISVYGEHFLPEEANNWLKSLQSQSPSVSWETVSKAIQSELGAEKLSELIVEVEPVAAASIGQVHLAVRKVDKVQLALKIQYPGVENAIDSDLRFLKSLLSLGPLLPKGPRFDAIFDEVKIMLKSETNYENELAKTLFMAEKLKGDNRFRVARVYPEYSTRKVLALEYLDGLTIDELLRQGLPQERLNRIGESFLDLYLQELLAFRLVQTDPHFGNYKVILNEGGVDQLVLLDFGAVRDVPDEYIRSFYKVIRGAVAQDAQLIRDGGVELKIIFEDDPPELINLYLDLCVLIAEPFSGAEYDWGQSDLPQRVARKGTEILKRFHLRAPPRETVFLDRKLGGTFVFLSKLKCKANWRPLLESRLREFKTARNCPTSLLK